MVEHLLDDRHLEIERQLQADVITYHGPISFRVDDFIRDAVEELEPKLERIAMLLQTDGGFIEVAERIARVLRYHYRIVEFVIPNYAMSAGTVLVMSGDAIRMNYYSILGSIDPQVQRADNKAWVPALGYLEKYDSLIKKAAKGKLTTAELTFLVEKFDPAELFRYEQERDLSITLLKEWLVKFKFKNWNITRTRKLRVTAAMKEKRAEEIAAALNQPSVWHTHSRGISMQTLRDKLNLEIDDFGKNPSLDKAIKTYEKLLSDYMMRIGTEIVIHTRKKFQPILTGV